MWPILRCHGQVSGSSNGSQIEIASLDATSSSSSDELIDTPNDGDLTVPSQPLRPAALALHVSPSE